MSTQRASCWSLTINNPTPDDEEALSLARQRGWRVDGQLEVGAEGTRHYQLIVHTPQVRFSAVKKMFPRAHIEIARNPSALASYVKKDDTRVGELQNSNEKYPSQSRFFELVWDEILALPEEHHFRFGTKRFHGPGRPHRLAYWKACNSLVSSGYFIENMAVNPMTLSAWDAFHLALLDRKIAGETSRQSDTDVRLIAENNVEPQVYNHAIQEVVSQEARQ